MKMKMILPMMLIAALPLGADAQNKSGLVMSNLDQRGCKLNCVKACS